MIPIARIPSVLGALALVLLAVACGSSGPSTPSVGAARSYQLVGFQPAAAITAGKPVHLAFTIQQPSGQPLTAFRRGSGPHTGVHLILVRDDLSSIVHRHPPIAADGRITDTVTFPTGGHYRLVVDAYPATGAQPNFQLFRSVAVAGPKTRATLPPFSSTVTVAGYSFTLQGTPHLHAIQAAFLTVRVTDQSGRPARFTPWYGALAHAIFFRAGTLDYFHTHVCGQGATGCTSVLGGARVSGTSTVPGRLRVGVLVPVTGTWRLFLQCQVNGTILTAPFTLKVGA